MLAWAVERRNPSGWPMVQHLLSVFFDAGHNLAISGLSKDWKPDQVSSSSYTRGPVLL